MENLFEQGIFACKIKMSSVMETRSSMPVFFTTIGFNDKEINKKKSERVEEYLDDAIANEAAYKDLLMHLSGILSYEENILVSRWLRDDYDSVLKHTISVPTNWGGNYEISTVKERERLLILFWENDSFKSTLNEAMA